MSASGAGRKLFKYHLEKNIKYRNERPLFFRRMNRWRNDSHDFALPVSKIGYLTGYFKYGAFAFMSWHYSKKIFSRGNHGHHEHHGEGHH
ncbi:unnamed protein product [Moneuplotes crassus]|uniref:Uncharacterized protein n=1 Tax=Euplotes crassus TaxID=5936 RepID=A0AAD2D9Q6_EUPCR|nr:unnamed protein product [Moneuplotes crassus]